MKRAGLLLILICGLAFFWRLGGNGLFDLDEALYTESAREMRLSGDFVTPRVNGEPFFEKPPFVYWEAALLFRLFGTNEFVARLPSALASTLLVAILFAFGTRCFGRRAGILAACSFALSPLVLGTARQLTTDATLDLWIVCALISLFLADIAANREGDRSQNSVVSRTSKAFPPATGYWLLTSTATLRVAAFWVACALGVLTK